MFLFSLNLNENACSLISQQTGAVHRQASHPQDPGAVQQDRRRVAHQTLDLHAGRRDGEAAGRHEPRNRWGILTLGSPSQLQSDQIGLDSHYLPGLVGYGCESGVFLTFQCTDGRSSGPPVASLLPGRGSGGAGRLRVGSAGLACDPKISDVCQEQIVTRLRSVVPTPR